jgi:hypothetical protein
VSNQCTFTVPNPDKPDEKQCTGTDESPGCGRIIVSKSPAHRIAASHIAPRARAARVLQVQQDIKVPKPKPEPHVLNKRQEAYVRGFDAMLCSKRGRWLQTVPCGQCGAQDRIVNVALCEVHGACAEKPIGSKQPQHVTLEDGRVVLPKACIYCPLWHGPESNPRR